MRWIKQFFFLTFFLSAAFPLPGLVEENQDLQTVGLPEKHQGKFPIQVLNYDHGVKQLIPLNNRWVIVVTVNIDDVVDEIDKLSGGQFQPAIDTWVQSNKEGNPSWYTYREIIEPLRNQYVTEAREKAGERNLGDPAYFTITSPDDKRYEEEKQPTRATRFIVSLGQDKYVGLYEVDYAHYSYIEFPEPMENGKTYTITLNNDKKVTFKYDEKTLVSRAIKVNQLGYLPDAEKKYAYLGAYLQDFGPLDFSSAKKFSIIDVNSGDVVYTGDIRLREPNYLIPKSNAPDLSFSGEDLYEMEFTDLSRPGNYFITIPGVGRSWPFTIGRDVYGEAFYIAARALFHQRPAQEIKERFSAWHRPAGHTEPIYESENVQCLEFVRCPPGYSPFDVIGATLDTSRQTDDPRGGWYDAADWDRRISHYPNILDMMNAYEYEPNKFKDGQLNIPESGNGTPDILDEVDYGLLVWKNSQNEKGGISSQVETSTHPPMYSEYKYAHGLRNRWASLLYAGAAAQFSRIIYPYDPKKSDEYLFTAIRAFRFGTNPENSLDGTIIHARRNRGKGDPYTFTFKENDDDLLPYLIYAKIQLHCATSDDSFLADINELLAKAPLPYQYPFSITGGSPWYYYWIFAKEVKDKVSPENLERFRQAYIQKGDEIVDLTNQNPYRASWKKAQDYFIGWGLNHSTNFARTLFIVHHLTGDKKYLEAAQTNVDHMLGTNPLGMSWMTGIGYSYPIDIQHSMSELDGRDDPYPGIIPYGPTNYIYRQLRDFVWNSNGVSFMKEKNKNVPLWRRWFAHPHFNVGQNEFTINETMSSAIFNFAMLMPYDWMPSEELKNHKPRASEFLFGYWYLP